MYASDLRGVGRLDPISGVIQQFLPVEGDANSLPSFAVLDLAIDKQNALWLGTDVALVRFDPVTYSVTSFDHSDGLENDFISSVVCTPDGMVWMSTHSGISSFDPQKKQFVKYSEKDGLSNFSYYTRSVYFSKEGVLYLEEKWCNYLHLHNTSESTPRSCFFHPYLGTCKTVGYYMGWEVNSSWAIRTDCLRWNTEFILQSESRPICLLDWRMHEIGWSGSSRKSFFRSVPGHYVFALKPSWWHVGQKGVSIPSISHLRSCTRRVRWLPSHWSQDCLVGSLSEKSY